MFHRLFYLYLFLLGTLGQIFSESTIRSWYGLKFHIGEVDELVYHSPNSESLLSRLSWSQLGHTGLVVGIAYQFSDLMEFSLDATALFGTLKTEMLNEDWLPLTYPDVTISSVSKIVTTDNYQIAGNILFQIVQMNLFKSLRLGLGLQTYWFGWEGSDTVQTDHVSNDIKMFQGKQISYRQNSFMPVVILNLEGSKLFPLSVSVAFSPYTYIKAEDTHIKREIVFHDFLEGGLFVGGILEYRFSINDRLSIGMELNGGTFFGSRGTSIVSSKGIDNNNVTINAGIAGTSGSFVQFALKLHHKWF